MITASLLEDFKTVHMYAYPDEPLPDIKQVTVHDKELFEEFVDDILDVCREERTIEEVAEWLTEKYEIFKYRPWMEDEMVAILDKRWRDANDRGE